MGERFIATPISDCEIWQATVMLRWIDGVLHQMSQNMKTGEGKWFPVEVRNSEPGDASPPRPSSGGVR